MNLYADIILDLWRNPQNFGELANCDFEAHELNPLCGDEVKIQLKLKKANGRQQVADCKFTGDGCAISVATASMLTEYAKGKKLADLAKLTDRDVISLLGIEIGPQRIKCATLSLITLKKAIAGFNEKIESEN